MRELRGHFRPEFLNRVDEIVLFKPLMLSEIKKIVDLLLEDVRWRLSDRGVSLVVSDAAKEKIANAGYDPVYGARPLRRYIQRELETKIGRALIAEELQAGASIEVDVKGDALEVRATAAKAEQAA
jgi:ATP-dependent Clp protease ATP-binding subunit ClpB